ncbi:protein STRUBBELIG-RECEPTOR FAMILY 2-like isoform X2 [Prunus avium]|uniref:Protein STRUBBELIG-RECEPTOR FAMILY 2-like isoform X2 n=1 Tax=Prunus avium TaxID=42229 RepID=A0A6P5TEC7_PRUAV|nr:protein STRUBBELIG-RECEPTOR FAMILY 2-like isoform X2 [Prunus avium]
MNVFYESSWPLFLLFTAVEDFYKALNGPPQLKGWRLDSGDPCGESWAGLSCSGSSIIHLKLQGLNLSGYLSAQLYNMLNLKTLDVSSNYIVGEIPYVLPQNATHMNLSHNLLSGPVGNVFTSLQNLRELDLSYNNLTGSLTSSFGSLTNLTGLFLQNNNFTGSVDYLAVLLPQTDMNIENNSVDPFLIKQVSFSSILQDEHKSKIHLALVFILFIGVGLVLASKPNNTGKGKRKLDEEELKPLSERFTKRVILVIEDQKAKETVIEEEEEEPKVKDKRRKKAPSPPKVKVPAHEPDPTTDPEDL